MKKVITVLAFAFSMVALNAQLDENSVMGLPTGTTAEIFAVTPANVGAVVYSTTDERIYRYTTLGWVADADTSIYVGNGSLTGNRAVTQNNFDLNFDANTLVVSGDNNRVGIGTNTPAGVLDARSNSNLDSFVFTQANGTSGERDVFTIIDQDLGGGSQDHSSVLKVIKTANISPSDLGFSLVELANTGANPGANKYWISGRTTDEGAVRWGVDITDHDYWSEGGIVLGATGATNGSYTGGNFNVTAAGQITSSTLSGTGIRMVVADANGVVSAQPIVANTDDQTAAEVNSDTPVDVDGDGTTEATVEDVIQDIAPIVSKAARIFYPPSIAIDASTNGTALTIDLYAQYIAQYGTPVASSAGAPAAIPTYTPTELYYFVTFADPNVFDNISINANGVMQYDIIGQPSDFNALINVVFMVR